MTKINSINTNQKKDRTGICYKPKLKETQISITGEKTDNLIIWYIHIVEYNSEKKKQNY